MQAPVTAFMYCSYLILKHIELLQLSGIKRFPSLNIRKARTSKSSTSNLSKEIHVSCVHNDPVNGNKAIYTKLGKAHKISGKSVVSIKGERLRSGGALSGTDGTSEGVVCVTSLQVAALTAARRVQGMILTNTQTT